MGKKIIIPEIPSSELYITNGDGVKLDNFTLIKLSLKDLKKLLKGKKARKYLIFKTKKLLEKWAEITKSDILNEDGFDILDIYEDDKCRVMLFAGESYIYYKEEGCIMEKTIPLKYLSNSLLIKSNENFAKALLDYVDRLEKRLK